MAQFIEMHCPTASSISSINSYQKTNELDAAPSLMSINSQKIGSRFTLEKVYEPNDGKPSLPGSRYFWGRARYLILAISILCFTAARSNEMTFSFTVICMTSNISYDGKTDQLPINFTPKDLSLSFAGAGTGAILAAFPLAILLQQFGGRFVMGILLILSSLATLALPFAIKKATTEEWSISSVVFPLRLLQGFAMSMVMPMIGLVSSTWSPISEMGNFLTLLSGSGQLSQIFTMPISAYLCVTTGWPVAFYFHGILSIIFAISFILLFTNSPKKHPLVSEIEVNTITDGVIHRKRKEQKIPYKAIACSRPIIGVWISFLGCSFGFQLILQFMPTYLNKVLGVPVSKTGFSAMLPPLSQLIVKIIAGLLSDKITCISERKKLQIFNSIAMCGCSLALLPLGFLHPTDSIKATACFCLGISCLGLISCSSMKCATLVSRQYSHFVMSVVQFVCCVPMLGIPFIVSTLAPNNEVAEWRNVFFVVAAILFITNFFFCYLCDSEAAPWTVETLFNSKNIPLLPDDPQVTVQTISEHI